MKKIAILLAAMLLALSLCATALAGTLTFSTDVNVRTGPGVDYSIMGSVSAGYSLTSLGDIQYDSLGRQWYSVSFNGRTGWVCAAYATPKEPGNTGVTGGGRTGGITWPSLPFLVKVSTNDLNIRTGPGTNYGRNGTTGKGIFTIVALSSGQGSVSGWGKLKSGAGWIALDRVSLY